MALPSEVLLGWLCPLLKDDWSLWEPSRLHPGGSSHCFVFPPLGPAVALAPLGPLVPPQSTHAFLSHLFGQKIPLDYSHWSEPSVS